MLDDGMTFLTVSHALTWEPPGLLGRLGKQREYFISSHAAECPLCAVMLSSDP